MRADLAPFGIDIMLALAGLGVLSAIGLPRQGSLGQLVGVLGLAYMAGTAVVSVVLVGLLVINVPFTLVTFAAIVFSCVGIGLWRLRSIEWMPLRHTTQWRPRSLESRLMVAFVGVFGAYVTVGMLSALELPVSGWDAWSIWARKAQMLTVHNSLIDEFFTNQAYAFTHLDYPLQYPIWEALHFRAGAIFDTQLLPRHLWLMLAAFIWALAYLLRNQVRVVVWAPLLLLTAAAPGVWQQLLSGYADVPMAMFACIGSISMAMWLREREMPFLVLAAIMLAATASTKNEGLVAAMLVLFVAGAIVLLRRLDLRAFTIAAGGVIISVLPWRIWLAAHGIEGDMPVSKGLQPAYLIDRLDRVRPAIDAINSQLADQSRWLFLLPLAALVVVASLASGIGRRMAAFYLGCFAAVWAALVWSYWISPHDLSWHLSTSADRVIAIPMFICVAALIHLAGILLNAALPRNSPRSASED